MAAKPGKSGKSSFPPAFADFIKNKKAGAKKPAGAKGAAGSGAPVKPVKPKKK